MRGVDSEGLALGRGDEGFLDTPNCAVCLTRMEPAEAANGSPYWACAGCGASRLA